MGFLIQTVNVLADLLITLIFIRVILSWFVRTDRNALVNLLNQLTEPILAPIRRALPHIAGWDLSPIIAYFLIQFGRNILNNLLYGISGF